MKELVWRERAVTLEILVHLIEVERRRLHIGLGYASILDESNAKDLIGKIRGKSQRDVESIVATYRPPVSMRDRAKPVLTAATEHAETQSIAAANSGQACPITPSGGSAKKPNSTADGSAVGTTAASSAGGPLQAGTMTQAPLQPNTRSSRDHPTPPPRRLEQKFHVQFLASERFMQKFERAKSLLSNKKGTLSYEAVLEAALDEFLKDHDPEQRKQRREERREKAEARTKSGEPAEDGGASRGIPAATRDAVFVRDKGQCMYVGSNGARCEATQHLQVDHIIPYARGGTNAFHNLRLLCERHNKREAERILGANAIRRFCRSE